MFQKHLINYNLKRKSKRDFFSKSKKNTQIGQTKSSTSNLKRREGNRERKSLFSNKSAKNMGSVGELPFGLSLEFASFA